VLPAGLRRFRPGRRGRGSAGVTRARLVGGEGVEARRGGGGQVGGAGTGPLGLRRIGVGRGSGRPVAARGGAHVRFAGGARVVGGARDGTGPGRVTGPALGRSAPADRGGVRGAVGTGVGGGEPAGRVRSGVGRGFRARGARPRSCGGGGRTVVGRAVRGRREAAQRAGCGGGGGVACPGGHGALRARRTCRGGGGHDAGGVRGGHRRAVGGGAGLLRPG